jgi:O-succinylbenzoic acid--CoA ligase
MRDWLAAAADARPDGIALLAAGRSWTFAELQTDVSATAARLSAAGVRAGDRVAVLLPNGVDYVRLIHALARLGAVLVPLNLRLTPAELRWPLTRTGAVLLLHNDETAAAVHALADLARPLALDVLAASPAAPDDWRERPLDLDAAQAIIFTSGTSGAPKGAVLTFGNHFYGAMASAYRIGVLPHDRWLAPLPLYHVGGLAVVLRSCLYTTTVVLPPAHDAEAISRALDTQAVTLVSLVPTMLGRLLDQRADQPPPPQLRLILLGGAAAAPDLLARAHAAGWPVATTYGLTEAASQVATMTPEDVRAKPGSVGKPLLMTRVRIVDQDGRDLPAGQYGEIVVSGPTVMRGYLDEPDSRALRAGELHTGDIGYLDDEGDLWLVQRRSDLIVSGGENIYPAEVEAALRAHPDVLDVCVVGAPSAEWGQQVAAAVVLRPGAALGADELTRFARASLSGYKLPRLIRFVDALPQTASGKIQRAAVAGLFEPSER